MGKTVEYQPISEEEMVKTAIKNGLPTAATPYRRSSIVGCATGWFDVVTDDVQQVTGQAPRSLAKVVAWRP